MTTTAGPAAETVTLIGSISAIGAATEIATSTAIETVLEAAIVTFAAQEAAHGTLYPTNKVV
jgi:hypothetical protein